MGIIAATNFEVPGALEARLGSFAQALQRDLAPQ